MRCRSSKKLCTQTATIYIIYVSIHHLVLWAACPQNFLRSFDTATGTYEMIQQLEGAFWLLEPLFPPEDWLEWSLSPLNGKSSRVTQ